MTKGHTLIVGAIQNRNWILGNLILAIKKTYPNEYSVCWTPSAFTSENILGKAVSRAYSEILSAQSYFFTFPSLYSSFRRNWKDSSGKVSVVLYTHHIDKLGSRDQQISMLNSTSKVFFMSERDRKSFVSSGLLEEKSSVLHFGFENSESLSKSTDKQKDLVVLASNYSTRKGIEKLLPVVRELQDIKFVALGRNWERSPIFKSIKQCKNFSYVQFDLDARDYWFPRAEMFLSLSTLEGGPVPLLEALSAKIFPIVTDTGFCRDFIKDNQSGLIFPVDSSSSQIVETIRIARGILASNSNKEVDVSATHWPQVARRVNDTIQILRHRI